MPSRVFDEISGQVHFDAPAGIKDPTIKKKACASSDGANDSIDWKKGIFAAAKTSGGIKDYYIELDFDSTKASVPYVKNLQV